MFLYSIASLTPSDTFDRRLSAGCPWPLFAVVFESLVVVFFLDRLSRRCQRWPYRSRRSACSLQQCIFILFTALAFGLWLTAHFEYDGQGT